MPELRRPAIPQMSMDLHHHLQVSSELLSHIQYQHPTPNQSENKTQLSEQQESEHGAYRTAPVPEREGMKAFC